MEEGWRAVDNKNHLKFQVNPKFVTKFSPILTLKFGSNSLMMLASVRCSFVCVIPITTY